MPEATQERFDDIAPGRWLLDSVPWTAAEHRIGASSAGKERAAILSVPATTACLIVERRTWRAALPVTHVRLTYPGDSHQLVARFTPAQT